MIYTLSENAVIELAANIASGTAAVTAATTDMKGFDSIFAFLLTGTVAASAANSFYLQEADDTAFATAYTLEGSGHSIAAADDNEIFGTDLVQPRHRYVRAVLSKDETHASQEAILYLKYRSKTAPTTQGTGVTLTAVNAPGAGTP